MAQISNEIAKIEQVYIGQLLNDFNGISDTIEAIRPEMFYDEKCSIIFKSIIEMYQKSEPVNIITVCMDLSNKNNLDLSGGHYFITELSSLSSTSVNADYHVKLIKSEYLKRYLSDATYRVSETAKISITDPSDIVKQLQEINDYVISEVIIDDFEMIEKTEVKLNAEIIDNIPIFSIRNNFEIMPLFTENSSSCIYGGAGSRKSFLVTLISSMVSLGGEDEKFIAEKNSVVFFDTEQSRYYTKIILERVNLIGDTNNFKIFNIKQYDIKKKKIIIESIIRKYSPKFVVIDNIRDLLSDINDFKESAILTQFLRKLQDKYKVHTCLVIHRNKADEKMRGHIGTEIENMCETVIQIEIDAKDEYKSKAIFRKTRSGLKPKDLSLFVKDNLPCLEYELPYESVPGLKF
jgi:hypothetical protein